MLTASLILCQAFGFNVTNCTTSNVGKFNYTVPKVSEAAELFTTSITLSHPETRSPPPLSNGSIHVEVKRKAASGCAGDMVLHTCELSPAVVKYGINLQGDIATFQSTTWKDDSVEHLMYVIHSLIFLCG